MDIYEMFYLCSLIYFRAQKDFILCEVVYMPDGGDAVLRLGLQYKEAQVTAIIVFDENGSPVWQIKTGEKFYIYDFTDNLTFDIVGDCVKQHGSDHALFL